MRLALTPGATTIRTALQKANVDVDVDVNVDVDVRASRHLGRCLSRYCIRLRAGKKNPTSAQAQQRLLWREAVSQIRRHSAASPGPVKRVSANALRGCRDPCPLSAGRKLFWLLLWSVRKIQYVSFNQGDLNPWTWNQTFHRRIFTERSFCTVSLPINSKVSFSPHFLS